MYTLFAHQSEPELFEVLRRADAQSVTTLEQKLSTLLHKKHVIAFNSPASATLAAFSASLEPKDEIVLSPISPLGAFNAASFLDISLHYCDIKLDGTLHEREFKKTVTPQSKAVVLFHYAGISCEIEKIIATAKEHKLLIIEDATQTLMPQPSKSDLFIYSLQSIMPSSTEKTGFVACDDPEVASKLQYFRDEGEIKRAVWNFDILTPGADLKLSQLGAVAALHQLEYLKEIIQRRQVITALYDKRFKGNKLIEIIPHSSAEALHFYPIMLSPTLHCPKEDIFNALIEKGIEVDVHTKPIYKTKFFNDSKLRLPVVEDFYQSEISLPCHHQLSLENATFIADTFLDVIDAYGYRGCSF